MPLALALSPWEPASSEGEVTTVTAGDATGLESGVLLPPGLGVASADALGLLLDPVVT
jgi:hypothetical protein